MNSENNNNSIGKKILNGFSIFLGITLLGSGLAILIGGDKIYGIAITLVGISFFPYIYNKIKGFLFGKNFNKNFLNNYGKIYFSLFFIIFIIGVIFSNNNEKIESLDKKINIIENIDTDENNKIIENQNNYDSLNYKIIDKNDVSIKSLGERKLSSFSTKELEDLPMSKRFSYKVIIDDDIEKINKNSINKTAKQIINDIIKKDDSIDSIFVLMYHDKERIEFEQGYDIASIVWAPYGSPSKVDSNIVINKDRTNYEIKVEINKNLDEYLEIRKIFIEANNKSNIENINLTLKTDIHNNILNINGTANLPDGSIISYDVSHKSSYNSGYSDGYITVENKKYSKKLDISNFDKGEIEVWVSFQTILDTKNKQPDETIKLYGEYGENIKDSTAVKAGYLRRVEKINKINK